jgi:quinol monooxygenase YgiN
MQDRQPILVAGTIIVPPANLARLKPHIEAYVAACRKEPGCIVFSLAEDLSEPGLVRVFEIWRDAAALDRHKSAAHVAAWRALWPEYNVHGRLLTRYAVAGHEPF